MRFRMREERYGLLTDVQRNSKRELLPVLKTWERMSILLTMSTDKIGCKFIKISAKTGAGISTDKVALFYSMVNPVKVQMSGKNLETTNVTITGASMGLVFAHKRLISQSDASLW